MPDYIIYRGDTLPVYNLILEKYLQKLDTPHSQRLFGLSFRDGAVLNCWRGYQAIYKVDHDSLFQVDIIHCGERRAGDIDKSASMEKMATIFGSKLVNDRVFIDWFTGDIGFPLNKQVLRWDGVFYTIFDREKVIGIKNGQVLKVEDVENYVHQPNAIDRRDKNKISPILFSKIKRIKWKKIDDCDCSDKYFVTIDEAGNVSNVRMLLTPEEREKYYDQNEYSYCVTTILKALAKLHFDILKDKGKPISEDIYIEIFFSSTGKAEDWTR